MDVLVNSLEKELLLDLDFRFGRNRSDISMLVDQGPKLGFNTTIIPEAFKNMKMSSSLLRNMLKTRV